MDVAALASAMAAAQMGQVQTAVAAKMMKMNANQDTAVAQLLAAAAQNGDRLANVAAGIGQNLDITV